MQTNADRPAPPLALQRLAGVCVNNSCPTVYRTNRGSIVVQGYIVTAEEAGVDLSAGEMLVEIPEHLLTAALEGS
jgi:hypothetical protein